VGTTASRKNRADKHRNPFNDRIIASGSDDGKVFIWEVPQGFTLYSDAEEPADVDPVSKLTGHSRYVRANHRRADSDFLAERLDKSYLILRRRIYLHRHLATIQSSSGILAPASRTSH
jgi:WD40 repeat protein